MQLRRTLAAVTVGAVLAATVGTGPAGADRDRHRPETIDLPAGFAGEGVASGKGDTFYAGSLADGRIARGDVSAGTSEVFIADPVLAPAVGLKADVRRDLLWVAGGPTGQAAVYDLTTGEPVTVLTLAPAGQFINDVVVTRNAAWFTNSNAAELYRVPISRRGVIGTPETLTLTGPAAELVPGFNLNGIAASADGRTLVVVNTAKGELYAVNAATGASTLIDLGGATVPTGDGLLLEGRTLYVVQNGLAPGVTNQITVIKVDLRRSTGRVVDAITSPLFESATTVAAVDDYLVAVNAQFGGAPVDPGPEVVIVDADRD